jgi:hypothetical protein
MTDKSNCGGCPGSGTGTDKVLDALALCFVEAALADLLAELQSENGDCMPEPRSTPYGRGDAPHPSPAIESAR